MQNEHLHVVENVRCSAKLAQRPTFTTPEWHLALTYNTFTISSNSSQKLSNSALNSNMLCAPHYKIKMKHNLLCVGIDTSQRLQNQLNIEQYSSSNPDCLSSLTNSIFTLSFSAIFQSLTQLVSPCLGPRDTSESC